SALDTVAFVTELAVHQGVHGSRDPCDAPTRLAGASAETESRECRRNEVEGIGGFATRSGGVVERLDKVENLEPGAGPARHEQEGKRGRPLAYDVPEVNVHTVDRHDELGYLVQTCLVYTPVVASSPVLTKVADVVDI